MILQNLVFPNPVCNIETLYFRSKGGVIVQKDTITVMPGKIITTDTYFNLFDAYTWNKYTGLVEFQYNFLLCGKGVLEIHFFDVTLKTDLLINKYAFDIQSKENIKSLFTTDKQGYYYVKIVAISQVVIFNISIIALEEKKNEISLGINICTFKRLQQVKKNIDLFLKSRFFEKQDILYGKMMICVVDNASELQEINNPFIKVVHNPNTGGSGGFTRGIRELKDLCNKHQITNIVFMDDDVLFLPETFYRLYALLSYLKEEYSKEVIAGRMFRMDKKNIQYTAVEKWNGGRILHVGFQTDMARKENLDEINISDGEYTGWWFGCFPMSFVKTNTPIQFFIHCDDVEYGLRHGGTPIILNGVHVWHETYEYRQSPVITYYDIRNSMFVNDLYGYSRSLSDVVSAWKNDITKSHIDKNYLLEYMQILALWHYLDGVGVLERINSEKLHKRLLKKKGRHLENAIFWRMCLLKLKINKMRCHKNTKYII